MAVRSEVFDAFNRLMFVTDDLTALPGTINHQLTLRFPKAIPLSSTFSPSIEHKSVPPLCPYKIVSIAASSRAASMNGSNRAGSGSSPMIFVA